MHMANPDKEYCLILIHSKHQLMAYQNDDFPILLFAGTRYSLYAIKKSQQFAIKHFFDGVMRYHMFQNMQIETSTFPFWQ